MKFSAAHCRSDAELLSALIQLPSINQRARFIHQHLRPDLQARLTEHLARIIGKAPSHRLRDSDSEQRVAAVYKPHRKLITRVVKRSRARKPKKAFG